MKLRAVVATALVAAAVVSAGCGTGDADRKPEGEGGQRIVVLAPAAAEMIEALDQFVGILATIVLLIRAANEVGVPVYGIVAGAGVSGLAIALAAKTTLENFMGTLNLYADRPVRVGDLCRYGDDSSPDPVLGCRW